MLRVVAFTPTLISFLSCISCRYTISTEDVHDMCVCVSLCVCACVCACDHVDVCLCVGVGGCVFVKIYLCLCWYVLVCQASACQYMRAPVHRVLVLACGFVLQSVGTQFCCLKRVILAEVSTCTWSG